jgi:signal transduction histidine kinase
VGIVILVSLVWTALYHRPWESACVVAAIVAVEVITSLVPVAAADAVIVRRVLLWGLLGALVSVATHGLRQRIAHSQRDAAVLQEQLREVTVAQDRDRIAAGLQDEVIQRIFAAGLSLGSAASLTSHPAVRQRVEVAAGELDQVLRLLRDTVFGLEHRLRDRGLRQEILELCGGLSPVPEISFTGPVDGALEPGGGTLLFTMLREALAVIARDAAVASVGVTVGEAACVTIVEAALLPHAAHADWAARESPGLREQAARAGARVDIDHVPGGVRLAWHLPLVTPGTRVTP